MECMRNATLEPIAIIGSGCRFPGAANSPSKLWELLKHPGDLLAEVPQTRFNARGFYHENPEHPGTTNVTQAYLLAGEPWVFDNDFFGINAREAASMDPQQRIILEVVYEAIEAAGYSLAQLRGSSTGVFVGQMSDDYRDLVLRDVDNHPQYAGTGIARSILANRVSYVFDWKGPSMNIDTACSSSLVALHQAVQSLRSGESDMAVVAGVNFIFSPELFSFLSSLRMLSPTGRSRMWDADADGYARGEGFAAVVIKPLWKAIADRDDIESVIRNTAINQDGRSAGLTVPSAVAQASLITSTYAGCGLDCRNEEDRCQYFEAHGTGTLAGDPKEAESISMAFFPAGNHQGPGRALAKSSRGKTLQVGSIKTVIGHLEGTAGLASLLKASLAVQHGVIPPNMHFRQLNPAIEPYYHHLEIPTEIKAWPKLPPGAVRRASVNSFGFGGTNAHVIVESWPDTLSTTKSDPSPCSGPFVLSANSEAALAATVESVCALLKTQTSPDLARIAWTLQARRTQFSYRASFFAACREELITRLEAAIGNKSEYPIATKAKKTSKTRILGVFTGQGAQWAAMGAGLFQHSTLFKHTMQKLESVLKTTPDAPSWSLIDELLKGSESSRTSSAEISQPLCTALQVGLVDLLRESGVEFSAVVGHSSGEIGAAYAAGVIGAAEAVLIAFYRGRHCSGSHRPQLGKMMVVGMAPADADAFCKQAQFFGKIRVAAENSPSNVTLSGDYEAIEEAHRIFTQRDIFARLLKVDIAYHSHHMEVVRGPYIASLKASNIQSARNSFGGACNWYSSVYVQDCNNSIDAPASFKHTYWADNLTRPVLFSQAISLAVQKEKFDLVLEVGPHPALRGPATDSIKHATGASLPYQGVLERNSDAMTTFSNALGYIWRNFDAQGQGLNFEGFQRACHGPDWTMPPVCKDLPCYPWDHDKSRLQESRKSKSWRTRQTPVHEILGSPIVSSNGQEVRWRNILRLSDLEWLRDHQFQNQVVFPGAGYLCMALDAAMHLVGNSQTVQLVELQDVVIHNAVTLEEDSPGVDMNFTIRLVGETSQRKTAEFSCSCSNADATSPEFDNNIFTGRVAMQLGPAINDVLPGTTAPGLPMTEVSTDRFYTWMHKIGLDYSDSFRLKSIKRRLNFASVTIQRLISDQYTIHPANLDSILQGLYAAFSYPGDGRLWTTYLPRSFRRVRIDMNACRLEHQPSDSRLVAACYLTESSARKMCGDIDVFGVEGVAAKIQAQGVVLSALEVPGQANDQTMFFQTVWKRDLASVSDTAKEVCLENSLSDVRRLHQTCERSAYWYLCRLYKESSTQETQRGNWQFQCVMNWVSEFVLPIAKSGQRQYDHWKPDWDGDTLESITRLKEGHDGQIDLELIHNLGSRLRSLLCGSETALEVLKKDGMLERLYTEGLGVPEINFHFGELLDHMAHQHAGLRVLEIGAGSGASTLIALQHLQTTIQEYTFTDLSPGFFDAGRRRFSEHEGIMRFRVLDIERSPVDQGFQTHSYDLIIAAHVLHATKSIFQTLQHCRKLLRPGGYLVLLELTNPTSIRIPFLFCALPGWWLGNGDEGRRHGPVLTESQWDAALKSGHFSGVDIVRRDFQHDSMHSFSVMVSQAVDDRISVLRDPLDVGSGVIRIDELLVVGGQSLEVTRMVNRIKSLLIPFSKQITVINSLEDVLNSGLCYGVAVICLSGLEEATFKRMDKRRLCAVQSLFREAKYLLWATRGCRGNDPFANIIVGIGRSVSREMEHLRLKFVDFDNISGQQNQLGASICSKMLLEMICLGIQDYQEVLWSSETEVVVEDGAVLIPRVVPEQRLNESFNSARRTITQSVSPVTTPVHVSTGEAGIILEKTLIENTESPRSESSSRRFQVLSSSLCSFICSNDCQPFYICLGYLEKSNKHMLVMSDVNGSVVTARHGCTFAVDIDASPGETLSAVLAAIICEEILSYTCGTIWVHGSEGKVTEILHKLAKRKGVSLFLTASMNPHSPNSAQGLTYVHPRATERELLSLIPRNITAFVNMGNPDDSVVELATSWNKGRVNVRPWIQYADVKQAITLPYSIESLLKMMQEYISRPDWLGQFEHLFQSPSIKANQVHEQQALVSPTTIISWAGVESVSVKVTPATSHTLFADQKTYFLVGLTGDVGHSLCDWMADHGAKYLAIASRKPAVPPRMIAHLQKKDVVVRIFSLDVADMDNLKRVHQEIVSSMPPVAGVINAALVVRDHPFDGMPFEDLEAVFRPKVVGSYNLDNLFYSTCLDFFILFSSVASIVGKTAQSSYNGANLFMSALALQRRKRGLAASVMHFGMLLGFGFIHGQAGPTIEARFRQDDLPAIPEPDLHTIFAQAILSGRPESGLNPEVIAGLGTEIDTPWRAMARFRHCRIKDKDQHRHPSPSEQDQPSQVLRDCLQDSKSKDAFFILKAAIAGRVGLALGSPCQEEDEHVGLVNLGLDSLIAVEIRSWLLKILTVDVPVMKLLSGASLVDICHVVLSKFAALQRVAKTERINAESNEKEPYDKKTTGRIDGINRVSTQTLSLASELSTTVRSQIATAVGRSGGQESHTRMIAASSLPFNKSVDSNLGSKLSKPIDRRNMYERVGDMSHAQAQLYFLHDYLQNNAHNVAYTGRFHGHLDIQKLKSALQAVGQQHEAMRSAFFVDLASGRPLQAVLPEPHIMLERRTSYSNSDVRDEIDRVKHFKFEIEKGVLMKVSVISHSPILHSIIFSHHHIALDGFGWSVFIADLAKAYSGKNNAPTDLHIGQSIDFAIRQLEKYSPEALQADLVFWKKKYRNIPEPLPLFSFVKKGRPANKDYSVNVSDVILPSKVTKLVENAAASIGVTSFHFYLATLATFLARCLGVEDVVIGVVDANRTEAEDMKIIGYFLNMLPVRIRLEKYANFDAIARRARDEVLDAMAHPNAPIDKVLDELDLPRSSSHHRLFQVAINYRKAALNETDFGLDGKIYWDGAVPGGHPYDMLLNVASTADWTFTSLVTQKSLYNSSDTALLLKWYTRALEALARDPYTEVQTCQISNNTDIVEVIELGRGRQVEVPWIGKLTDRLATIAALNPDDVAIRDGQHQAMSYEQMMARTMQISYQLYASAPSLTPGSHVAMLLDPVADAICCICAILRSGFVWVPLDTRNHHARLRAVIKESRPQVLLCHNATRTLAQEVISGIDFTSILNINTYRSACLSETVTAKSSQDDTKSSDTTSSQPAMILYTSGSTGVPKGVVLTHGGLLNQIFRTTTTLNLKRETSLQHSPLGFNLMLDQIFLPLCNGGTVVVVGNEWRGDPVHMAELMVRESVTITHFVPSEYLLLLNYGHNILKKAKSWRYAMSGGEKLGQDVRRAFHKLDCSNLELVNVYRPAEITLACARGIVPYYDVSFADDDSLDYLVPSPNYSLEIVDEGMKVLPVGYPGEICITGPGVRLGYLQRCEETMSKFINKTSVTSPKAASVPHQIRVYRSGDKGRLLPDGTLQVLGRLEEDSQVKIHGIRVELNKISNTIVNISSGRIINTAASLRPGQLSDILIAFVVFDAAFTGDRINFVNWLRNSIPLPQVMMPSLIVPVERIPATANGKTDRVALNQLPIHDMVNQRVINEDVYSLSSIEQSISDLWREMLSTRTIGMLPATFQPSSDFFQLGGSSILLIKLKSLLQVKFGINISMPQLFHGSTLGNMATLVTNTMSGVVPLENGIAETQLPGAFLQPSVDQPTMNWSIELAGLAEGLPQPNPVALPPKPKPSNGSMGLSIVLTGSTGFVGTHLLSQLVQEPRVANVHYIAIRPNISGRPRHIEIKSGKITEYSGDLSHLSLGLSDAQFSFLASQADIIIHNGADVSLLKTYQSLRRANIIATRTLCQMAIPHRLPLHYVLTASVAKVMADAEPLGECTASSSVLPELLDSLNGYAVSKWVSEMLLKRAAEMNKLPAYIHRLAHVEGHNASGLDAISMLTKYSLLLREFPRLRYKDIIGDWDFVAVENVARTLVTSAVNSAMKSVTISAFYRDSSQPQQPQKSLYPIFINYYGDVRLPQTNLKVYLEGIAGELLRESDRIPVVSSPGTIKAGESRPVETTRAAAPSRDNDDANVGDETVTLTRSIIYVSSPSSTSFLSASSAPSPGRGIIDRTRGADDDGASISSFDIDISNDSGRGHKQQSPSNASRTTRSCSAPGDRPGDDEAVAGASHNVEPPSF